MSRALATALVALALTGCGDDRAAPYDAWRDERSARQATLDRYLADRADDVSAFVDGDVNAVGFPMIAFRVLPDLFPEYWGTPEQQLTPLGFERRPERALPIGLGFAPAPVTGTTETLNVVGPTCALCHMGRVIGPGGEDILMVGAPAGRADGGGLLRVAYYRTVTSPRFSAAELRAALDARPLGWVYGDPALRDVEARERALWSRPGVAEAVLAELKAWVLAGAQRSSALDAATYRVAGAPPRRGQSGYLDLPSFVGMATVNPATMTTEELAAAFSPLPAPTDIMPAWMQRDRAAGKWDGLSRAPVYMNLGAALVGSGGDPRGLNVEAVVRVTGLVRDLPAPPYPFDVDGARAARGEALFLTHCASCHAPGNPEVYPPARTGTDPNRARAWTPYMLRELLRRLRGVCTDSAACPPLADEEIFRVTEGYMALPLHGVWAAAPYLHNGSVPTLRQLLTGRRAAQFYRGNARYDVGDVGYVWDRWAPGATLYDTRLSGQSNTGHDTPEFLGGVNWADEPELVDDLLEFMKTL